MLKVGITGSFGVGKSTVASMLSRCGASVIDVDGIVHELFESDRRVKQAVEKVFGSGVMTAKGVDRKALGKIVFDDPDALKVLQSITHPAVSREIKRRLKTFQQQGVGVVIIDAAILIEAGWVSLVDKVVVVKAKKDVQIRRVMARTGLTRADVQKRLRQQMPFKEKCKYADFLVDNSGPKSDTDIQIRKIWKKVSQ
jgi:dephospho-CoA kinase